MGSIFKQQYYTTKRGKRVKRESKKWYIQYWNGTEHKREPAYTDRTASLAKLVRREKEVANQAEGIADHLTKELGRPIGEHLADFIQHLRDRRNTTIHCQATQTRIERVCKFGGIETAPRITRSRVDAALAKLRDKAHWKHPLSTATSNHYLTAVKAFAQWLRDERRIADNLIAGMRKRSVEGERVKQRRPLSPVEFAKLIQAATKGAPWQGIAGPDRAALYTLASFTGYRRRELASITPAAFTFGAAPALAVARGYSKRRRVESIPLKRDVAEFFRGYVAGKPAEAPLWPIGALRTAEMIQADLKAAKVPYKAGIEVVDFHSLRQVFTTGLARAGVSPKVTQQLARHSDINLTMSVYAKMDGDDERAAVESLATPEHLTHLLTHEAVENGKSRKVHGRLKRPRALGSTKPTAKRRTPKNTERKRKKPR